MGDLTIGTLAAAVGVGVETVRFYQRKGLIEEPPRAGGIRRYDSRHIDRLAFIKKAQVAGFTLAEIGELLALDAGQDRAKARELARQRIAALEQRISELMEAKSALERLAKECASGDKGPCPIIASFQ